MTFWYSHPKNERTNSFLVRLGKKTEFIGSFLEESEDTISRFEIIWPLKPSVNIYT